MKRSYKWVYPVLVLLLLFGLVFLMAKNREHNKELKQLRTALESFQSKESNYEERLNHLRTERQEVIDNMVAAYKDNVHWKSENKLLSKTVEELYLRNVSNLQLLFGTNYEPRIHPDFDRRVRSGLQQYMDAVSLEDEEGHSQMFHSERAREHDPIWQHKKGLIGFLLADFADDQRVRQIEEESGVSGPFTAIQLFALTKDYDVITATLLLQPSGNGERIVWID